MNTDKILDIANTVFADRKNMSTFTFFATDSELIEFAKMVAAAQRVKDVDSCLSLLDNGYDFRDGVEHCVAAIIAEEQLDMANIIKLEQYAKMNQSLGDTAMVVHTKTVIDMIELIREMGEAMEREQAAMQDECLPTTSRAIQSYKEMMK